MTAASDGGTVVERLARIETKLDVQLTTQADHETRLRRLERALWIAAGFSMAGGATLSQLASHLM